MSRILQAGKWKELLVPSMTCGYISYKVNYAPSQSNDPQYSLNEGDTVEGAIVNLKVEPYEINGRILHSCKVPVFCSNEDPIEFEVQTAYAYERAGKVLLKGQLQFGDFTPLKKISEEIFIPRNCLVVSNV